MTEEIAIEAQQGGVVGGRTIIADSIIETIASVAARKVDGVHKLGKGVRRALKRMSGGKESVGVDAEVGTKEVAIDLRMVAIYGANIPLVARMVRAVIAEQVGAMTGLLVKEVNIDVVGIHIEGDDSKSRVE